MAACCLLCSWFIWEPFSAVQNYIASNCRMTTELERNWLCIFVRYMLAACVILRCSHTHAVIWRPYMQIANLGAPWKFASCLENFVLQALQFQEVGLWCKFPGGTGTSHWIWGWVGPRTDLDFSEDRKPPCPPDIAWLRSQQRVTSYWTATATPWHLKRYTVTARRQIFLAVITAAHYVLLTSDM